MNRVARQRLFDALEACRLIALFTASRTFVDYEADPMLSAAVERKFEIIGEALRLADSADESIVESIPELRLIVGLRNRIIHGYDVVDNETIWNVIQVHIPRLRRQLESVMGDELGGIT